MVIAKALAWWGDSSLLLRSCHKCLKPLQPPCLGLMARDAANGSEQSNGWRSRRTRRMAPSEEAQFPKSVPWRALQPLQPQRASDAPHLKQTW